MPHPMPHRGRTAGTSARPAAGPPSEAAAAASSSLAAAAAASAHRLKTIGISDTAATPSPLERGRGSCFLGRRPYLLPSLPPSAPLDSPPSKPNQPNRPHYAHSLTALSLLRFAAAAAAAYFIHPPLLARSPRLLSTDRGAALALALAALVTRSRQRPRRGGERPTSTHSLARSIASDRLV